MNTNTNNHKTSYSIIRGLFFLIMCSVIFTVLYYSLPRQNREPAISDYIDFSEGWTTSDGSPVDFSHISGTCTVTKKLPALTHDMALFFFYKSSNVTILIDDRLIYETMQPERVFFGKTPGASYVSLPIYREDSGCTLTLVIDNPYGDGSGKINHMYLGRSEDILISRIRDKAPGFGISFLIAHLGLAFILFYLPLHKKHIIGSEMLYLGLFALNTGIFMLADNRMLQLILRNSHIYHTIAELFMMLITIPLFLYLGKMYTEYSPVMVQTVCLISVMDFSIRFCLNLTGLKDFHESLRLTHITFGILIALVIYAIGKGFYQNQRQHLKHNLYHNLGILCLCFGVLLDILLLWFGSAPETSFFTRIGVLLFLIMEAVQVTHVLLALYDVNSLKYVNDTYGHQSGDKLICRVADTLSAHLGSLGKCYRIGGDEFVFLSTVFDSEKEFLKLQRDFEASLGTLKLPDGSEHPITVAMGYSVLTHTMPRSMDDMVREADAKMYEAKRRMKTEN